MRKYAGLIMPLALMACDLSTEPQMRNQPNQLEVRSVWNGTIQGTGGSTLTGTATVRDYGSYSEAEVAISGAAPSAVFQWRIFRGSCQATAAAQLALHLGVQSYPDLVANGSGTASITRLLGGSLNSPAGEYSIRFRNATTTTNWNGTSPVACGDLHRS